MKSLYVGLMINMVKTIIEKIDQKNPDTRTIRKAAEIVKSGGLVVYPTETCYGLAADATNVNAVKAVYAAKKRPKSKPIPIIVSSLWMMRKYGKITKSVKKIVKKFMPGPLTVVTDKRRTIPDVLNPREIAFRISSHPIAAKLVRTVGRPITATSANISGQPPIYKAKKLEIFNGKVDMILDCGDLKKVKPSTYVDARSFKVLRIGAIPRRTVLKFIERIQKDNC